MATDTIPSAPRIYPLLKIKNITDPSRFYAIPLLGILTKFIMLIPVYIFLLGYSIGNIFILFVNSFVVLFTGNYMPIAYELNLGLMRLSAKIDFFYSGITNSYPGFSLKIEDPYTIDLPFPKNPNRWFAVPIFGGLFRIGVLIPFYIYNNIVKNGVTVALLISWFPVLTKGMYPETTFELDRDYVRLNLGQWAYMTGLSDTYPSFWISLNHKNKKIALLIAGTLLFLINSFNRNSPTSRTNHSLPIEKTSPQAPNSY
jgi:hypothetical protein